MRRTLFLTLGLIVMLPPLYPATAAPVEPALTPPPDMLVLPLNRTILRIQTALQGTGDYLGSLDGRMTPALERAIRTFQKKNRLKVTGQPTQELARQIETRGRVKELLGKLRDVRERETEAARKALLSNPETRHLVKDSGPEKANPLRDTAACFSDPTPKCLLDEAVENAKAVADEEQRDWAFSEILTTQARVGLMADAMASAERISDLRLIVVALRKMAGARAQAGRFNEAYEAVEVIPDDRQKLEAVLTILEAGAVRETQGRSVGPGMALLVKRALKTADEALTPFLKLRALARITTVLSGRGDREGAEDAISRMATLVEINGFGRDRDEALRLLATAYAQLGEVDKARSVLGKARDKDATPVLVAASRAMLDQGAADEAYDAAADISAVRYRSVALSRIAVTQWLRGEKQAAETTLTEAREAAAKIAFSFARSFAYAQVVKALARTGRFDEAVAGSNEIDDAGLKARALWEIAELQGKAGDPEGREKTADLAWEASDSIASTLSRCWMFAELAEEHMREGRTGQARSLLMTGIAVADAMGNAWSRARALARLALTLQILKGGES